MALLFMISQHVDRLFEFIVGPFRFLLFRPDGGLQRIVNDLRYTFTTVEQGLR